METTYRDAIAELETILRALETDTVDVDELTARVQRSAQLIRLCKQKLRTAEDAIDRVFENLDQDEDDSLADDEPGIQAPAPAPAPKRASRTPRDTGGGLLF
ncbi:exodeoxyribonuclease VII small subunit [Hymenobacter sp. BT186]|uniref:Exodeoxyribonuclease 7 small subunit n=1 Tax=Hymenobacter telluris TaxID=2816474 RepID=A0A939JE90_9BACT|nr:exodeoxyribonuclease VII small subunit [Hymenobacter telluris]MBO0360205.1 exodeoxyribonuclease VII small subunit [Hymenobacter telluris]MBW3376232.1 exodeoxyribonuclease VII small subunit [Hymenobacter norwichensis]